MAVEVKKRFPENKMLRYKKNLAFEFQKTYNRTKACFLLHKIRAYSPQIRY
jgi:hypothetical protein